MEGTTKGENLGTQGTEGTSMMSQGIVQARENMRRGNHILKKGGAHIREVMREDINQGQDQLIKYQLAM